MSLHNEEEDGHGPREMEAGKILQNIRRTPPMDKI
jgi:hypothetical protein